MSDFFCLLPSSACLPAVHISDGLLTGPWLIGGFVVAGMLALFGAWGLAEDEIPRVAVLTAAFFVASSLRMPLGPSSAHLLLNGLLGVVLGRRAMLAIPVGVFMQAALLGHGGMSVVGVNSAIQVVPALIAWQLFAWLQRLPGIFRPGLRSSLVGISGLAAGLSLVFTVALFWEYHQAPSATVADERMQSAALAAWKLTSQPLVLAAVGCCAAALAWVEWHLKNAPEFPLGLLVGELTVLLTVILETAVLILGGVEDWRTWALIGLVAHMPIAVIEGLVLGFTVGYLARVKPEMLGWKEAKEPACPVDALP
jgi:cobalt/nickel transport system permease protein